jgi:hypothetical protein
MPNTIPLSDWLKFIDAEYLSTFLRSGGASIKFAVVSEELRPVVHSAVKARSLELGYVVVELDAATIRAHMPQDIFFGLASQIDWRHLARRLILRQASEKYYRVEGVDPNAAGNIFDAIAEANHLESQFVIQAMRPAIQDSVFKNSMMAKDFRVGMSQLCRQEETREDYTGQPLLDWLTGTNTGVSNVRPFSIYTRINRTTARYFLESALFWVRYAGYAGTVILLDNSRVTLARNPKDGKRYYTRAMAVDHYQLLREFVDGVDRLTGTLLLVMTTKDFLDETPSNRGYGIYEALRTRVMDDVRDRNLVNPVASLVRLSEGGLQDGGSG